MVKFIVGPNEIRLKFNRLQSLKIKAAVDRFSKKKDSNVASNNFLDYNEINDFTKLKKFKTF